MQRARTLLAMVAVMAASCTSTSTTSPTSPTVSVSRGPSPARITWPPDAISFSASNGARLRSSARVMAVSASGGTPVGIELPGHSFTYEGQVAWSPDGSRLAFIAGRARHVTAQAGDGHLFVMRADGTHLRRLTSGASVSSPSWSPTSSKLVVVRNQGTELVTLGVTGTHVRVISSRRGYYQSPAWSPGGRWIAVQSAPAGVLDVEALYLIHPDGSGMHALTDGSISEGMPAWSPDGRRLAFRSGERLWSMNPDGSDRTQLTRCHLPCVGDLDPAWSPNGGRIAFIRQEANGGAFHLYVMDLRTKHLTALAPGERWARGPSWRPSP